MLEHWRSCVLPDLQRFYPNLQADQEAAFMGRPWRQVREVLLSLFGIPDSLTGATYARLHARKENQ